MTFTCHHPENAHPPTPRACWLFDHRADYRRLWKGGPRGVCRHASEPIPGPKRQALGLVHAKDWRECGMGKGVVCPCGACAACDAYEADRPPQVAGFTRRNLLFHLMPVPGRWEWHAERLRRCASLFDGRRIVAVVTRDGLAAPADVAKAFGPDFEIIEARNDPTRREVVTFELLFSQLEADDSCTLYAQGMAVTHAPGDTKRRWAEMLYETLIDHWPAAHEVLKRYPVAGSFKKLGAGWPGSSESDWHYSGSWFWFRNRNLLARPDWRRIDPHWWGIESYPSLHYRAFEAGAVFHVGRVPALDLFSWDYLRRVVEPELARWKAAHAKECVTWG